VLEVTAFPSSSYHPITGLMFKRYMVQTSAAMQGNFALLFVLSHPPLNIINIYSLEASVPNQLIQ
jgi:hypothetical protein